MKHHDLRRTTGAGRFAPLLLAASLAAGCQQPAGADGAARAKEDGEIAVATAAVVTPTCVTLRRGVSGAVADTQVANGDPSLLAQNYGTSLTATSGSIPAEGSREALFRFDLGGVPAGSAIVSAKATMTESSNAAATIRVHQITQPWTELGVSWNSFAQAFSPAVAASFSNGGPSSFGLVSFDVTALAQVWVNNASVNDGILLEQDPVGSTQFFSSENTIAGRRPQLVVCYRPATCADGIQDGSELGVDCGGSCPTACPHPPATELVNGGDRSKSPHYTAVYTFGQSTQNQDKSTSPSYRVQGGLAGANGSLP